MIIGVSGYARSGKDTLAQHLVKHYGFKQVSFADILREAVFLLNPIVGLNGYHYDVEGNIHYEYKRVSDVIDEYGWGGYKETPFGEEIRALLQRLGTEVGRQLLGEDIWVTAAFRLMNSEDNYVLPDCRFINEARTVKEFGGTVIRVNRPGYGPVNSHASEVGLDDWDFDYFIDNDGTQEEFAAKVDEFMLFSTVVTS